MADDLPLQADESGLVVAYGTLDMLASAAANGANLFRVDPLPSPLTVAALMTEGFLCRPAAVTWVADLRAGDDEFLACLGSWPDRMSGLRIRFFAKDPRFARYDAARVCYLGLADHGRAVGCTSMRLGNDWNLYGHMSSTGVCRFKRRLGFRPLPKNPVYPGEDSTVLERHISPGTPKLRAISFVFPDPQVQQALVVATIHADRTEVGGRPMPHFAWRQDG